MSSRCQLPFRPASRSSSLIIDVGTEQNCHDHDSSQDRLSNRVPRPDRLRIITTAVLIFRVSDRVAA